ncbi:hypothetical protein FHS82_000988 [Pseudochelatococcus lubricantis]|uniref:Uncharacterized protein n=1 Tax=Pseudochelatococcus lubricantis TaxID=1538102 RepID=A0ABX0UWM7_9HYPH|nr:hypothetical protein [Pseudochelatococcus lubricantis]NIJ57162.1 hypothetical protein [Pseudochelatococcus lubricantis]
MADNHPAHPIVWGNTVEAIGLTKREWLMAQFPMDIDGTVNALRRNGFMDTDISTIFATHAKYARIWADAIIKGAARE